MQEMREQTAAVLRLAESNQALIEAIAEGEDDEEPDPLEDRPMTPHPSQR